MAQESIKVDAGTGSDVEFQGLATSGFYRQGVTVGDPSTDANLASVDAGGNLHVLIRPTFVVLTQFTNATLQFTNSTISALGNVAHDDPDSGNPVKVGYVARTALPTAVANSDRVNSYADKFGRQVVIPNATRDIVGTNFTVVTT